MLQYLLRNSVRVLGSPEMLVQYLRWCWSRMIGYGPVLKCTGGKLFCWTDFSDYWWGRQLALIDESDLAFMRRVADASNTSSRGRSIGLDIGANIGLFCLNMKGAGFTEVHAFEANPVTFARLARHSEANHLQNVNLMCAAVGEFYGLASFVICRGSGANHVDVGNRESDQQKITVVTISIDDYCCERGLTNIDFVKIDVEGYEPWVLRGMKTLLREKRIDSILIEICPGNLDRAGSSVAELVSFMDSLEYEFRELKEDGIPGQLLSVAQMEATRNLPLPFINAICIPKR